jgi:hypothetical protein
MLSVLDCSRCVALADRHRPPVGHLLLMNAMIVCRDGTQAVPTVIAPHQEWVQVWALPSADAPVI